MGPHNLLEHFIYFLSAHRGKREICDGLELVHSDKPYFNIAIPLNADSFKELRSEFKIYVPDWLDTKSIQEPAWIKTGSLTFMILPGNTNEWQVDENITIVQAMKVSEFEDFSLVQGRGFCESEDDFNEWYPWMRQKNLENFDKPNQRFYVGYRDEKPVSVCLSIIQEGILGIYAVATLPHYRKMGISSMVMKQAIKDYSNTALEPNKTITLQVITGSYAHKFYKKLGFEDVFSCSIYSII